MSKRIDLDTEIAIKQLLSTGKLSQRAVAKMTGISRFTVQSVAQGRRPIRPNVESVFRGGPASRCPGCGSFSRIHPEVGICRACQVRRLPGQATPDEEADTLAVDFPDQEQQQRYEEMRAKARLRWLRGNRRLTS